jgi:hypothetical protein
MGGRATRAPTVSRTRALIAQNLHQLDIATTVPRQPDAVEDGKSAENDASSSNGYATP